MKRRALIVASAGVAGGLVPNFARAAVPCPPPQVTAQGGTTALTTCATAPTGSYSTSFGATENPLSAGGVWTNGAQVGLDWSNVQTGSGNAYGTAINSPPPYNDSIACLSGFSANQYIEGIVHKAAGYNPPDNHEIELFVRCAISAHNARGYEVNVQSNGAYSQIVRWNGPANDYFAMAASGPGFGTPAHGDVMRVEVKGNTITVFKNGAQVLIATDASFSTGNPGIGFWCRPGGTLASFGWQSITAGGL